MSTIEKMSIQGVRSFGPDDSNKQIIQFFTPLTLILGPNGTGKTTIIECLKYMTTGIMPPGSKGGAFIHDPKVAHEREVKGQIGLKFRDVSGQQCIVQRSMVATQKAKKIEMRTLEGVVTRKDRHGEKKSINSKCADLDREMITSLGVSRPVLENVIFCHQEDSNWPLSEGKALKEKFDAIFASTRYVKALETIRKVKQGQDGTLKLYKQDIGYLKQHKDKAAQLNGDLSELEAKLAASKESVDKISKQLEPIEEKLDQIDRLQNNITELTSEKKAVEKHAEELQLTIENEFQGSDEELKQTLAEFQDKLEDRQLTLQEFESKQQDLARQLEKLDQEKSRILVEVGRLEQEAERHESNVKKRDDLIRQYADQYEFEGFSRGAITEDKYKSFLENIRAKMEALVNDTKKIKGEYEEKESNIQTKIDELRDMKTKLEQSEKMKRDMMNDNKAKIRQINQKLSEVEASAGRLDQLKRELKRDEHELQQMESEVNTDELKQEISDLGKEKTKLDQKISELSNEMNAQAQLDVLKKDKSSKEESIRRLKAKQEDTIKCLLGHMPTRNIRGELDEYIGKQSEDIRKCNTELQQNKNQLSKKEMEKKMNTDNLKKKEIDLKDLEERVFNVCGSQNYDEGLQDINEKMSTAQDTRGSLLGAEHFFKKYVNDLEKDDPCCPLCHREFETDQEVRELVLELKGKLRLVPTKLKKAEKDLDEFRQKYNAIIQLKPLKEQMTALEDKDIPSLKKSMAKTSEEIEKLRNQIDKVEEDLGLKETDEAMAKDAHPDIVLMDRYFGEVQELDKKIAAQAAKLTGGDTGRTLQNVINEKEDIQIQVDSLTRQLDHKRNKLSDHSDQVQLLRGMINSLREEKLGIENDLQQRIKLEEDKTTLENESETYSQEIKEASEKLRPLQGKIDKFRREKETLSAEKEEKVESGKAEVDAVKNNATKVRNVNQEIKSYNQSGKAETLEKSRTRKTQIQEKAESTEEEQKDITENIDKLRKDLSTQKIRELELQNNMNMRNKWKEVDRMKEEIKTFKDKLGGLDVTHLERDKKKLQKQQEDLTRERHTADGRQRGFEDQIRGIKKELQTDMYKDAEEKYRNKMIEMRTTELANLDLEKYYRALDKAIMNYHNMKMEEINKIIRDLWRNTYKGNDIETIEIRSDEDESTTMKTRRTYNYRVVMLKGDTALDMRGRCSAGQKVLASLIIRLALAETFCLNCGILALDEPTTNLDRENIESLACALVDIIKGRSHQRNFQLVIITHDEDFVELLGRSDYVDSFFKVCKDNYGCSRLKEAKVNELHVR